MFLLSLGRPIPYHRHLLPLQQANNTSLPCQILILTKVPFTISIYTYQRPMVSSPLLEDHSYYFIKK